MAYRATDLKQIFLGLGVADFNFLLFRCWAESSAEHTYCIPGYGHLPYAGIASFYFVFFQEKSECVRQSLIKNLLEGTWAPEYCWTRLCSRKNLTLLSEWMQGFHDWHKDPLGRPRAFSQMIQAIWRACTDMLSDAFPPPRNLPIEFHEFWLHLRLVALQMLSNHTKLSQKHTNALSMAAGLPHFARGFMRCWGRDIAISIRGLMLCSKKHQSHVENNLANEFQNLATEHLVAFGQCCFQGLIPNLLDEQKHLRFNARDATWLWACALIDYIADTQDYDIMELNIVRRFPVELTNSGYEYIYCEHDDPGAFSTKTTVKDVLLEILLMHYNGINFLEEGVHDESMRPDGLHIQSSRDEKTGFIFGGNQFNAGTWMDKMGSVEGVNRGMPSTPRCSAAIEIQAMLTKVLKWVVSNKLYREHATIFEDWLSQLKVNFEKCFWDESNGYYRDCIGSCELRPNQAWAMAICSELFSPVHAQKALKVLNSRLIGPLGMRTLDPDDPNYRPNYDLHDASGNASVAGGANYHNGPEWVWLISPFLKAAVRFNLMSKGDVLLVLSKHREYIGNNPWMGLPELTNADGAYCRDACPTQTWSSACLIELLWDLFKN